MSLEELKNKIYNIKEFDSDRALAVVLIQSAIALKGTDSGLSHELIWAIRYTAARRSYDNDWLEVYNYTWDMEGEPYA